jgi:hypothetical protein
MDYPIFISLHKKRSRSTRYFIRFGVVIGGLDGTHQINENDPNEQMGQYYVGYAAFDPEMTGFRDEYNANNDNQVRHFLAGASGGNRYGVLGQIRMIQREYGPGGSAEDRLLYRRAFAFVTFLHGHVPLSSAGDWVLNNLAK